MDETNLHVQQRSDILNEVQESSINFKTQVQEWKNILIRGNNPEQFVKYVDGFSVAEKSVQEHLAKAIVFAKGRRNAN